jgi:hypothetical protein
MKTLATIAVFLTLGTFAASAQSNKEVSTSATKVTLIDLPNPEQAEKSTLNKLKTKLDLTDAQVAELKTVLNKKETVINAKLKQILTPAQAAKMADSNKAISKDLE